MSVSVYLGQGGGNTSSDICPESLLDCAKRGQNSNGLGPSGSETRAPWLKRHVQRSSTCEMYPQPEWDPSWPLMPEAAKPTPARGPNRVLDFRAVPPNNAIVAGAGKGHQNQEALYQYYAEELRPKMLACAEAGEDVIIRTNRVPMMTDWFNVMWEVRSPAEELVFDIAVIDVSDPDNHVVDSVLVADVDGSVRGSGRFRIPDALHFSPDTVREIGLVVKAFAIPPEEGAVDENGDPIEMTCEDMLKPYVLDAFSLNIQPGYWCMSNGR